MNRQARIFRQSNRAASVWLALATCLPFTAAGTRCQAAPAILWVTLVSHFDRPAAMTDRDLDALGHLANKFPNVPWTHLFNPVAFTEETPLRDPMRRFVVEQHDQRGAEIGVHTHMYRSLVEAAGVVFRTSPSVSARSVADGQDASGYAVPMSAYSRSEIAAILELAEQLFEKNGLGRPSTFCAGFYTTSLSLQQEIVKRRYTVSAAAFPQDTAIGAEYAKAWQLLCGWDGKVSHRTRPYRVSAHSILPGGSSPFLTSSSGVLVEIPQTCKIDWMVSAEDMQVIFREHLQIASEGQSTAVCLAIHEVSAARYAKKYEEVLKQIVDVAANHDDVEIRFVTCRELREQFLAGISDK